MRAALFAVIVLAWAAAAGGQDCLSGTALLDDQRSLATLRASLETTCPCTSATSRSAYQHCATDVIDDALAGGSLRAACEQTARAVRRGASCGSTKVPCGRFTPDGDPPLSCRPKPATRCKDRRRYQQESCGTESFCTDVVDWTASTCVDARAPGPFQAGARVLTFVKDSVVSPGTDRILDTVVWYPTTQGDIPVDPAFGAVLNAPVNPAGAPYPVVLFSHGSCGLPQQSIFLTAQLATHGFVVIAPPHPGNTIFDFPSCGTQQAQVNSFLERGPDVIFVLNEMLDESADPLSSFYGTLDPDRIGMMGHSFGGLTTYGVAASDPRIKVAVSMAAAVIGTPMLTVPPLIMLGQIDSVVNNDANRTAHANAQPPKYLVEIQNAGHYAFSGACFPSSDCNPPVTLTQAEAHDAVLRWVLPFLKLHLAGDARFAAFFAQAPPGFVFEHTPAAP